MPWMSCSSYLNGLWDGKQLAVQLLFCEALLPGFVQDSTQKLLCSSHLAFSLCVSIHRVHPKNSIDIATTWKKSLFILLNRSDFHIISNLPIAFQIFTRCMLTSLSVNEMLLVRYVKGSTYFWGLPLTVEMVPSCLKYVDSVLLAFM